MEGIKAGRFNDENKQAVSCSPASGIIEFAQDESPLIVRIRTRGDAEIIVAVNHHAIDTGLQVQPGDHLKSCVVVAAAAAGETGE